LKRSIIFLLAASLLLAMVAGVAQAKGRPVDKGKPAGKGNPVVTYVFKGEIATVNDGSISVDVEKGNHFASSYAGQQVEFSVSDASKIVKDDAEVSVTDLAAGDNMLVQSRAPKQGAESFAARAVVVETPDDQEDTSSGE
jgi:hypothetical protein